MDNPCHGLSFIDEGKAVDAIFSYSVRQYLIVERESKLTRAVLFLIDTWGDHHNYNSLESCMGILSGESDLMLYDVEQDTRLDIERKLIDEGVSLTNCQVVHSNTLYIPFISSQFGSVPELFPYWRSGDRIIHWSLHII